MYLNKLFAVRNTHLCYVCHFCYLSQLHLMKLFKFCLTVSFDNLYKKYLDFKYNVISKVQTAGIITNILSIVIFEYDKTK